MNSTDSRETIELTREEARVALRAVSDAMGHYFDKDLYRPVRDKLHNFVYADQRLTS